MLISKKGRNWAGRLLKKVENVYVTDQHVVFGKEEKATLRSLESFDTEFKKNSKVLFNEMLRPVV